MKQAILVVVAAIILSACGGNSAAVEQAKRTQEMIKENTPGTVPTSATGFSMKAKVNGKEWVASTMMPPEAPARIIGYLNGESISLPYDRRDMVVGSKTNFETSAVDLFLNDDVGMWGGHKGEMEVTKVDENGAEGKFYFTATDNNKTVEVTEGFFRVLFSK